MSEMCSVCLAADRCPYYGQDSYYWNECGDRRCDEIIETVLEKTKREYYDAWISYTSEYED